MSEWVNARWTQARQIVELTDPNAARGMAAEVTPDQHFALLTGRGELEAAATFLGLALPRLDGIAWAQGAVSAGPPAEEPGATAIREAVAEWLKDPTDERRRDISALAEDAPEWGPERILAHAVFLSGGSIAPPDLPAVNPEPDLSGRLAAAAVVTAAHMTEAPEEALARALSAGEALVRINRR